MEVLDILSNLVSLTFVLATIISMGLSLTLTQIIRPLRNPRFVMIALLANFVLVPAAAYILIWGFSLDEASTSGLLLVSLAAGAPGLPKLAELAKADIAAATGLMVLLLVVTIIILPIALPFLITGVSVTFWDITSGLVFLILLPLVLSLFVRARYQEAAATFQPYFTRASNYSLVGLIVLMVVLNFNNIFDLLGSGGLLASLILVIVSVVGGYLLGGLGGFDKVVQAFGAGQRNIAVAMVVATMNFGDDVMVMVVIYSLIGLIIMIPWSLGLGKRAKSSE